MSFDKRLLPGFAQLVAKKTWPDLDSLCLVAHTVTDDALSKILGGMQRIISIEIHHSPALLSLSSIDLLRAHFSKLKVLRYLRWSNNTGMFPMAQEILSSCPLLEEFTSTLIDATLVAKGKPWVCLRLKSLNLSFGFEPSTISRIQPLVLDQLSRLTRLRELRLWGEKSITVMTDSWKPMDLRLESGLGKLSTLRALEIIVWAATDQRMGEQEIDWMVEHWKCLNIVNGNLEKGLKVRLQKIGIRTR
jgi:hypothetical protein